MIEHSFHTSLTIESDHANRRVHATRGLARQGLMGEPADKKDPRSVFVSGHHKSYVTQSGLVAVLEHVRKHGLPRCTEQEDCETGKVAGSSKGNAVGASLG